MNRPEKIPAIRLAGIYVLLYIFLLQIALHLLWHQNS